MKIIYYIQVSNTGYAKKIPSKSLYNDFSFTDDFFDANSYKTKHGALSGMINCRKYTDKYQLVEVEYVNLIPKIKTYTVAETQQILTEFSSNLKIKEQTKKTKKTKKEDAAMDRLSNAWYNKKEKIEKQVQKLNKVYQQLAIEVQTELKTEKYSSKRS